MVRKWMMALAVTAAAGAGAMLAPPAAAQSMYDGIGTGDSSPVMGPGYQYLAPEEAPVTGALPNEVIVAPSQSGVNTDESEGGVGLSSPELTQGAGVIPGTEDNGLQTAPNASPSEDFFPESDGG